MTAFASAIDLLFEDPNFGLDAVHQAAGTGTPVSVRVIKNAPDAVSEFNGGRFVADSIILDVRTGQLPALAIGDTFTIGDETFQVFGEPQRDALRLIWKAQVRAV